MLPSTNVEANVLSTIAFIWLTATPINTGPINHDIFFIYLSFIFIYGWYLYPLFIANGSWNINSVAIPIKVPHIIIYGLYLTLSIMEAIIIIFLGTLISPGTVKLFLIWRYAVIT